MSEQITVSRRTINAFLSASAFVLAGLLVVSASDLGEPALAEMVADTGGDYVIMTTQSGNEEYLYCIDQRGEQLMVYRADAQTNRNENVALLKRESLSEMFVKARAASGRN